MALCYSTKYEVWVMMNECFALDDFKDAYSNVINFFTNAIISSTLILVNTVNINERHGFVAILKLKYLLN